MTPYRASAGILGVLLIIGTVVLAQQHSYTQADIDAGSKIYENSCGGCHGENGDKVVGIDFVKGQFKTAQSDDDMVRVIRSGVPNTAMPSHPFTAAQADTVVAYVRSMLGGVARPNTGAAVAAGDAARGKTIFDGKGNCGSCHSITGAGGSSGPDLGPVAGGRGGNRGGAAPVAAAPPAAPAPPAQAGGGRGGAAAPVVPALPNAPAAVAGGRGAAAAPQGGGRGGGRGGGAPNPQQIQRSILEPNAELAAAYRIYQVVPKTGQPVKGALLNQDTFSVQLRDSNEKLVGFQKQDLREFGFLPSPMPSYKDKLTAQEVADVVSYVISLRSN